jgi:hypothetical protein
MMEPKYPNIPVKLVGQDGNAFSILARCRQAMRQAGLPKAEIDAFFAEAKSGDYNHLLATCVRWFEVE